MYAQGEEILRDTLRNYAGRQDIRLLKMNEWTHGKVSKRSTTKISKKRALI